MTTRILRKKQKIKKKQDDEIKDEIDLNKLKEEIDAGEIPKEIEFYFGGPNQNFFIMYSRLNLNRENSDFIEFLSLDIGSQIFMENMFWIHIETGIIFYDNYNTNEPIYDFLLK